MWHITGWKLPHSIHYRGCIVELFITMNEELDQNLFKITQNLSKKRNKALQMQRLVKIRLKIKKQ